LGIGDWGLGIGDWGLGPIPNPQSPIPNPQSPIYILKIKFIIFIIIFISMINFNIISNHLKYLLIITFAIILKYIIIHNLILTKKEN